MKKLPLTEIYRTQGQIKYILLLLAFFLHFQSANAVTVTAATGGGALCAGVYTTLGNIVITEAANGDFAVGAGVTLILTAPAGYEFNPGVGTATDNGQNVTVASIAVTATTITITYTSGAVNKADILTISGIQARAIAALPVAGSGNILRTAGNPGTGTIAGIVNGTTNFGTLTQAAGLSYASSTTTSVAGNVNTGSTNNAIIGIQVVTSGTCGSYNLTQMNLDVNGGNGIGTDNPATNISNAKIYYTGTSSTFAPVSQFGSTVVSPAGTFNVTGSQTIQAGTNYFWLVYDVPVTATVGNRLDAQCTQLTFDGGIGVQVPTLTNPAGSRTIVAPNVFTVGASRTYLTIQAAYNALPAPIANGYIIEVYGDYNPALEPYPVNFVDKSAGSYTITIRPAAGVAGLVCTGDPGANAYLFNYNGAKNVIFDGRPGGIGAVGDFTIRNRRILASIGGAFSLINDASFNELKYLKVEADPVTPNAIILFSTTTGTTGNSNNSVNNCTIQDLTVANGGTATLPFLGLYSVGTVAKTNKANIVDNCKFIDIYNPSGVGAGCLHVQTNNDNWTLTNNHFYQTANYTGLLANTYVVLSIGDGGGHTVTGNFIGGQAPNCGGATMTFTGSSDFRAINTNPALAGAANIISGNTISNITYTNTATTAITPFYGILIRGSGNMTCGSLGNGNIIGSTATTAGITINNTGSTSLGFNGIYCTTLGTTSIAYNQIAGITVNGSAGASTDLITCVTTAGSITIDNNILGNTTANNILISSDSRFSAIKNTSAAGITVTNNTIQNILHAASTQILSVINNSAGPLIATGNSFNNIITSSTGATGGNGGNTMISHYSGTPTTAAINTNTVQNIALTNAASRLFVIELNSTSAITVDGNTIGGAAADNISIAGNGDQQLIYKTGTGALTATNNIFQNILLSSGGAATGLEVILASQGPFTCTGNTIQNININTTSTADFGAIWSSTTSGGMLISNNIIKNINFTNATAVANRNQGIYVTNGSGVISKNSITQLTNASTSITAKVVGLEVFNAGLGGCNCSNNVILLDNNAATNPIAIYGIECQAGSNNVNIWHNTVKISGSQGAGASFTSALYRTGTATYNVTNNIFQNLRTGGTGGHFAEYSTISTGTYITNYNYLEASNPAALCKWVAANQTLATWRTSTGDAANSITGTTTIDINGVALTPFAGAGTGTNLTIMVPDDKIGVLRATTPWMGAYEGATITTSAITPLSYCQGATVVVDYTITGTFNAGNVFTAELSDASGSFATPTSIGTLTSQVAGSIVATIPAAQPAGTLYRIRVSSSNPVINGADNGANIIVSAGAPGATTATAATLQNCLGFTANWNANAFASFYELDVATDAAFTSIVTGYNDLNVGNVLSYAVTGLTSGLTYYYRVRGVNGCGTGANSNTMTGTPTQGVFVVSSTANGTTADGVSLRWAITQANLSCGHDLIRFQFGAGGPFTIALTSALPALTDNAGVTIDGWLNAVANNGTPNTTPVFSATGGTPLNPIYKIIISSTVASGLIVSSDNNIIQGLVMQNVGDGTVSNNDISINISGNNNSVLGCYIGLDATGVTKGTRSGIGIQITGANNKIGDGTAAGVNLISGMNADLYGVLITGAAATGNTLKGNIIGLQKDGTTLVTGALQRFGVLINGGALGNIVGGSVAGEGNVISGQNMSAGAQSYGVVINTTTGSGNTVLGNIIGPCADGVTYVTGNRQTMGVFIDNSPANIIGGNTALERNIISANETYGIFFYNPSAINNVIKGNYIGINKNGNAMIANSTQDYGIFFDATSTGGKNLIGGTALGAGNVISGNNDGVLGAKGIYFGANTAQGNIVYGNIIGPQADGLTYVAGNAQGYGIYIASSANNSIGSGAAGARNIISANGDYGIYISGAVSIGNIIKGNYIGTDSTGTTFITSSSQNYGIFIDVSPASNTIGGTASGEKNVISGNSNFGIYLTSTAAAGNTVIGNYIGPQANGTSRVTSNIQTRGIVIQDSPNNIIGGSAAGAGNVVSANEDMGVLITGAGSTGNLVRGNYIGIDKNGTTFIANSTQDYGVNISTTAGGSNIIGGSAAGEGNLISGNKSAGAGWGVQIASTAAAGNTVIGNIIGPQADGTSYVASNGQLYGVSISDSRNNTIGGATVLSRNIISANETAGVYLTGATSTGNIVKGNYIGIDKNGTTQILNSSQDYGIFIANNAASNIIGGTTAEGNVISGNKTAGTGTGIYMGSAAAAGNTVTGNIIGPQADGSTYVASNGQSFGIFISDSPNNIIGGDSSVTKNVISANETFGIDITGAGSSGNIVKGNFIGLNKTGTSFIAGSNQDEGVYITSSATNNTVGGNNAGEGNVISGNSLHGIALLSAAAVGQRVIGNIIGPQANGTSFLTSSAQTYGIVISGSPNNIIGGSTPGERNIISANDTYGVHLTGAGTTGNLVKGNYIGIDKNGTTYIANSSQDYGVYFANTSGGGNTIGGSAAGEGNVLSGNRAVGNGFGVYMTSTAAAGNSVLGNIIGPQANGTSYVAGHFQSNGIYISGSPNNIIGSAAARNVISGNTGYGIVINAGSGNIVKGNYLGAGSGLAAIAGSNQGYGIAIILGATNNIVGGTVAGEENIISFNTLFGAQVRDLTSTGNKITRNPIYSNTGNPISLQYGVAQGNNGKAIPVISSATIALVSGTSGANNVIEVFKNTSGNCLDATTYVGTATADGAGNWSLGVALANTDYVLATATDASNNTSEFCACMALAGNTVTTTAFGPASYCRGATVSVPYTITGTYVAGNIFTAELSDATGSFAAPVSIGTLASTAAGTITATIPSGQALGSAYRIRVVASNPVTVGSDNGANLTVSGPTIFTVLNTNDAGAGSLRQAIIDANANCGHDTIKFNIAGAGPHTITPATILPNLTDNAGATIHGFSQTGASPNTIPVFNTTVGTPMDPVYKIILANSGIVPTGLYLASDSNIIKGLVLQDFGDGTVSINDVAITIIGNNNQVLGCNIGMDITGTTRGTKTYSGVQIYGANNIVGNGTPAGACLISGMNGSGRGVIINNATANNNRVRGNIIGLQKDGTTKVAGMAQDIGVYFNTTSGSGNVIGGSVAGEGNVISGNTNYGINLTGTAAAGNSVFGNIIGPQANGTTLVAANTQNFGIYVGSSRNNTIGGNTAGHRNILSANQFSGIYLTGATTTGNLVKGNYIGIGKDGVTFIAGNAQSFGVYIETSAASNIIGGSAAGEGNLISGNKGNPGYGIYSSSTAAAGNTIQGNIIGPQKDGLSYVASNGQNYGIYLTGSRNNTIGGNTGLTRNIISANEDAGVYISGAAATGNVVKGNYIGLDSTGTTFITGSTQDYGVYFVTSAASNTIGGSGAGEGNVISGNSIMGIFCFSAAAAGNSIFGNTIGPQFNGTSYVAGNLQGTGIYISGSPNNIVGGNTAGHRNIISANESTGVVVAGAGSTGNIIKGNYIGIDRTGTTLIAGSTQDNGLQISSGSNTIGGSAAGEGNVISGNKGAINGHGIYFITAAAGNSILGNIIGPQADGITYVASNGQTYGIRLQDTPGTIIGGNSVTARNVISANEDYGIYMSGAPSTGNIVKGNYIGIAGNGTTFIAGSTQDYGVFLAATTGGNTTIGGNALGEGNVISGNKAAIDGFGIYILTTAVAGNTVTGNIIGPQANGASFVAGNGQRFGVYIDNSVNNIIGGNNALTRNIISANEMDGVHIAGVGSTGNIVKGNYIGTDNTGTSFIAGSTQDYGVYILGSASGNTIGGSGAGEGNVISGNNNGGTPASTYGINLQSNANNIFGNIIGLQANGTSALGTSQGYGILVTGPNNIIGGNTPGHANTISGNETTGIHLMNGTTTGNIIKGNIIGLDKNGINKIPLSTQDNGIFFAVNCAGGNTVGGLAAGEGNIISGQEGLLTSCGIALNSAFPNGQNIYGNIIGLQIDGTSLVAGSNQRTGIYILNSRANVIGGNTASHRNIISGNTTYGINLEGASATLNIIKGNYIGPTSTLTNIVGSSQDYGISVISSALNNTIGSTVAGEENIIAFNTVNGLFLNSLAATGNKISGNPIYKNTGKPINLNYGASQANNGLAFPVLTGATVSLVTGTAPANASVEVFSNTISNSCFDAYTYLGTAVADGAGNWSLATVLAVGDTVLATATNAGNNTSEFSACIPVLASATITTSPIAPTLLCRGGSVSVAYTITGTFNAGNIFTAQLSDAAGSFAAPVAIGTLASTVAGTINATIPAGSATGAGYRIRVVASNPATTGADNGANLTVPANGGAGTWTWTGGISTNWFDPCNWDMKCLPDLSSDVIIPGATPFNPLITGSTGSCKTIQIQFVTGANVTIDTTASGQLQVAQ
jgi:hypothetical protein